MMAENSVPNNIVENILTRLDELSSRISPQATSEREAEVRHVFTGRRTDVSFQSSSSAINNSATGTLTAQASTSTAQASTSRPATVRQNSTLFAQPYPTNRNFVRRHNFQEQHPSNVSRRQAKVKAIDNRPFMRDLVLLDGPATVVVPRQGARLALMEKGHVISGCRFTRGMNAAQVEIAIMEALDGKVPQGVDIEILMSVHTSLVAPTLAPGQQGIDGALLQRLFQNKPVYVRPSKQIIVVCAP